MYCMKVSKENVRYLVFEGGGGKGVTYVGALQALDELEIVSYLKKEINGVQVSRLDPRKIYGISGTSVGSITALLIACGYTPNEIEEIVKSDYSENLLDTVEFDRIPTIYTKDNPTIVINNPATEKDQLLVDKYMKTFVESEKKSFGDLIKIPGKYFTQLNFKFLATLMKGFVYYESRKTDVEDSRKHEFIPSVPDLVHNKTTKTAIDMILDSPSESFNSLKYEFGFFLAEKFRILVDNYIEVKSGIKNCTFKQFQEEFQIDLVITGYDVATNETYYFRNNERWKDLCVADAIRMSISIPIVFKPVSMCIVDGEFKSVFNKERPVNYIVDGGLGNAFPFHVFDEPNTLDLNSQVLGFFLEFSRPSVEENTTFFGFLENMFLALIKMTTRAQFRTKEEKDQAIELDSKAIKVLDFVFEEFPEDVINDARKKTLEYFN